MSKSFHDNKLPKYFVASEYYLAVGRRGNLGAEKLISPTISPLRRFNHTAGCRQDTTLKEQGFQTGDGFSVE